MGGSDAEASAKAPKKATAAQDQPPATSAAPATPAYPDWSSFQAYSPIPPHGFFPSPVASSPPPHPYMWGPQPIRPPYGTPPPPYVMYPHGVYAHPSIPPGSHSFSQYAMPSPNGNAEALGAVQGGMEVDGKSPEGKEKSPLKSSKGSPGSLNTITGKNNNDPGKTSGASANGGMSHSGESRSEASSEGSDANSQNDSQSKTSVGQDSYDEAPQTGSCSRSSQNGVPRTPSHAALNQTMPIMSMAAVGVSGGIAGPTTNVKIGMDYWGATAPSPVPPTRANVPTTAVGGAMVPGVPPELWMQVFQLTSQSKKSTMLDSTITEVAEMNLQSETRSGSTKNIMWTTEMDMCATDELLVQMHKGNKIDRTFTNLAYQAVCSKLFAKCGVRVSVGNLKNRLKTLKKDLVAFQDIQASGSGFSFNRVTSMMDAEPKVWKDYIDAHPEGKSYQHKPLPSFENMLLLFGNDRATGKDAETIKERRIRLERERKESNSITSNQEGDKEVEHEEDGDSVVTPSIHKRQGTKVTSTSSKVTYKRKHATTTSMSEDFRILKNGMDSVASAISKCGPHVYTEKELFEEVLKVEGLDEDGQILAYDYLCGDTIRGRTFIGLPISRRKRWLELKLGWSSHNREIGTRRHL